MRYFIELSYNGTEYHGWQIQPNAISVQEVLTNALTVLWKQPIEIVAAGRTDAGVHARQMFVHLDIEPIADVSFWIKKLNSYLPKSIAVHTIIAVHDTAHARFDAHSRSYEYHIHQQKNVFLEQQSWYYHQVLNVEAMNEAAALLLQHTDFECFSKTHTDVHTFNCKITHAKWEIHGTQLVFHITADRFLRNMVRAIVGTLINVGLGKTNLQQFQSILNEKNRSKAGFSVPAHGLYLTKVGYPYL